MSDRLPADPFSDPNAAMEHDLHQWRVAHPTATFAEIESVVEGRMRAVRARWVRALASVSVSPAPAVPTVCPHCGGALVSRGTHPRTVTVTGDHPVTLTRPYRVCSACGSGLFPP